MLSRSAPVEAGVSARPHMSKAGARMPPSSKSLGIMSEWPDGLEAPQLGGYMLSKSRLLLVFRFVFLVLLRVEF